MGVFVVESYTTAKRYSSFLLLFMSPLERKAAVGTLFLGFSLATLRNRRYLLMPARK